VTDTCGTSVNGRIRVEIREVVADFEYDPIEYYGIIMRNLSRPLLNASYFWDFGDGSTSREISPRHFFNGVDEYTITLVATDEAGCEDVRTRTTIPPSEIFIPSAFSPNGDGINELFFVQGSNITEFQIWIYDRWGNEVFYANDMDIPWNGSHKGGDYHNNMTLYNLVIRYKGKLEEDTFERTSSITVIR
jgi:gliding motility-associated-like protein